MAERKMEPDYGLDAPGFVRKLLLLGLAGVAFSIALAAAGSWPRVFLGIILGMVSLVPLTMALLILVYAGWGKFRVRDRMLAAIDWTGAEDVLDVGTGRGLLVTAAAKKLITGKAVGIDVWHPDALTGNNRKNAQLNAELEGVRGKVEVRREEPKSMHFPDASFDVVLSNFFLHLLRKPLERERACQEIARVLKPGGVAVIADSKFTDDYAAAFARAGCALNGSAPIRIHFYPPLRLLIARKPLE
jgi:arsenite methyltransferase